jgi:membrane fusion protein, multidrug efflux system
VTVLRTFQPKNGPEQAIVDSGINPGDTIVTEGQLRLTPGARISLLDTPRGQILDRSSTKTKPAQ